MPKEKNTESSQKTAWTTLLSIALPILTFIWGVYTWTTAEENKLKFEVYKRKEEKYEKLIISLKGFYTSSENVALRDEFINQLNLSWMYCPDEVIKKGYDFLETVSVGNKATEADRTKACGELMTAIRLDLMENEVVERTEMKPVDFKLLYSVSKDSSETR